MGEDQPLLVAMISIVELIWLLASLAHPSAGGACRSFRENAFVVASAHPALCWSAVELVVVTPRVCMLAVVLAEES